MQCRRKPPLQIQLPKICCAATPWHGLHSAYSAAEDIFMCKAHPTRSWVQAPIVLLDSGATHKHNTVLHQPYDAVYGIGPVNSHRYSTARIPQQHALSSCTCLAWYHHCSALVPQHPALQTELRLEIRSELCYTVRFHNIYLWLRTVLGWLGHWTQPPSAGASSGCTSSMS